MSSTGRRIFGTLPPDVSTEGKACENVAKPKDLEVSVRLMSDALNGTYTEVEWDEGVWAQFARVDKVRQALGVYRADTPQSGVYSVFVKGKKSGRILATVVNGNYSD